MSARAITRFRRDFAVVLPDRTIQDKGISEMPSFVGASGRRWSYDADKPLGPHGGFGEVFLASDGTHEFAVKRISLKIGDQRERRRREREVEIAHKLTSGGASFQHVLVPIDWGMLGEDLLLVMPKADGSLVDAMVLPNFGQEHRYHAIRDVALGLAELCSVGILHRDLKPGNVLWYQGAWRLSDFGISRDEDVSTGTYTFNGVGTMPYMAPEVWELRPATPKTDLYALGVLAYEVLTGRLPFHGPEADDYERQHRQETPASLQIGDGRMSRLVTRLLSKDPASRPQDAQAVAEVIDLAMRRLDPVREEIAAAAAAMSGVLSQRDAEKSKAVRLAELGKQALGELGAFLADFADDMRDVFPGAAFAEKDGSYRLHLDAAYIFTFPIEQVYGGDTMIAACSIQAALPGSVDYRGPLASGVWPAARTNHLTCTANLLCNLVGNRFEWMIGTITYNNKLPCGFHDSNIVSRYSPRDQSFSHRIQLVPLTVDNMAWLIRHTFESLTYDGR
jgi:hypothetical protein